MRRMVIGAALAGAGVLTARRFAPKLHERMAAGCEHMLEQMPETFPPKRAMRSIEEIRGDTARILETLEQREQAADEPELDVAPPSNQPVGHAT